jgi:hypothetical protein
MEKKIPTSAASRMQQQRTAPEPMFSPTRPETVRGMLAYKGKAKTLQEMDEAITAEVKRRHARGRY